ncbi:MAG: ankyrin repeat domain-containing protein [Rickettsiella sp.]|nr:ankyrin repeat domain-containing protein [Rickettsiella sp.]
MIIPKTLKSAALSGNLDATSLFLKRGGNPNQKVSTGTLLQHVIRHNFTEIAILLMEYGAEVNTQDKFDNTPLHEAAKNGNVILVKHLLSKNANILIKNFEGKTPGFIAAELGFLIVARLLHPAVQTTFVNVPSSFFKFDQRTIKNAEKVEIGIDPSFIRGIQNFNF